MRSRMFFVKQSDKNIQLPFVLHSLGLNHLQENINRPAGLPFYQWIQTDKGSGVLEIDEQKYTVEEGEGMLLFADVGHRYYATSAQWRVHYLLFAGHGVKPFFEHIGIQQSGVYRANDSEKMVQLMEELHAIHTSTYRTKMYDFSRVLYGIMLELAKSEKLRNHKHVQEQNHIIHVIMDHINQHYMEPISLADLANKVHLSKEYLCHLFKKINGFTIFDYLTDVRISHAKMLLVQNRNEKIINISKQCGYEDASYFVKVFKSREGMTPSKFREMHW